MQGYYYLPNDSTRTSSVFVYRNDYYKKDSINVSIIPDTLGTMKGAPNFLRYRVGNGHITIHAAPLALSNYFLLQSDNIHYMDGIWETLPDNISTIYWNNYFKHSANVSDFGVLMRYPATRWALLLALIAL